MPTSPNKQGLARGDPNVNSSNPVSRTREDVGILLWSIRRKLVSQKFAQCSSTKAVIKSSSNAVSFEWDASAVSCRATPALSYACRSEHLNPLSLACEKLGVAS